MIKTEKDSLMSIAITLIEDDLVNSKFLDALEKLDLLPSSYYLKSSESIIKLIGFKEKENEKAFEEYLSLKTHHVKKKYNGHSKSVTIIAKKIYRKLVLLKIKMDNSNL